MQPSRFDVLLLLLQPTIFDANLRNLGFEFLYLLLRFFKVILILRDLVTHPLSVNFMMISLCPYVLFEPGDCSLKILLLLGLSLPLLFDLASPAFHLAFVGLK